MAMTVEEIKAQIISLLEEKRSLEEQSELGCAVKDDINDCNAALKDLLKKMKKAEYAEASEPNSTPASEAFGRTPALPIISPPEYDDMDDESFP